MSSYKILILVGFIFTASSVMVVSAYILVNITFSSFLQVGKQSLGTSVELVAHGCLSHVTT